MDKIDIAKDLLERIGMPTAQQSTLCCLTLLAMANVKKDGTFQDASNDWIRIHDVISFIDKEYGVIYAENSRETFRKQAMHHFRTAAIIEDNGKATNSPNYRYRLTDEFLKVVQSISEPNGTCVCEDNDFELERFINRHQSLKDIYASKKQMQKMPVNINNQDFTFRQVSTISCRRLSLRNSLLALRQILSAFMWETLQRKIWLKMWRSLKNLALRLLFMTKCQMLSFIERTRIGFTLSSL